MQATNPDNRLRLVSDSEARLRSIIATLEESRAALIDSANAEAAQILAVVILQLRIRLHRIADSELRALCETVLVQEADRTKKADNLASRGKRLAERDSRWPKSIK
jgi:hypothetical protein